MAAIIVPAGFSRGSYQISGLTSGGGGGGAFTFISGTCNSTVFTSPGGGVIASSIDTTGAGLLIVVASYYGGATGPALSDSKGNSWTPLTVASSGGGGTKCTIYYSVPTSVGASHTITFTGSNVFPVLTFAAFALGAASPADQESQNSGSGTASAASASITPTVGNELVISGICNASNGIGPSSVNGGFTVIGTPVAGISGNIIGGGGAYLIQTSAVAAAPTWTLSASDEWSVKMASFKVS